MRPTLIAVVLASIALSIDAQSTPRDFAKGPAQWLMTAEERRDWRNVKTDDEAIDFIDLFWARRDPTPGTGRNENRTDFDTRVAYADQNFKEGKNRGSLTERGRVLVVLGFPSNLSEQSSHDTGQMGNPAAASGSRNSSGDVVGDPTGGRTLAAKDVWNYSHELSAKYNTPLIEVVFIYDGRDGGARRDPQRTGFTMALPYAIKSYIVSPSLTTVPDWASSRMKKVPANAVQSEPEVETTVVTTEKKTQVIVDVPPPVAKPASMGRLMLLHDSMALQPQAGTDPFTAFTSVIQFKKGQELGWAAEYCAGEILADAPTVKVQLRITAANGDTVSTDPEEFVPDSIKASAGCYLLRGALPLSDFDPGPYKLMVTINGVSATRSYNLTRDFRIE
jgi:GWxTD domain-containing protein